MNQKKMNYHIRFSKQAKFDIDNIYGRLLNTVMDEHIAKKQIIDIKNRVMSLKDFPERYSVYRIINRQNIRKCPFKNYSIYYFIENNEIIILRIIYNKQIFR